MSIPRPVPFATITTPTFLPQPYCAYPCLHQTCFNSTLEKDHPFLPPWPWPKQCRRLGPYQTASLSICSTLQHHSTYTPILYRGNDKQTNLDTGNRIRRLEEQQKEPSSHVIIISIFLSSFHKCYMIAPRKTKMISLVVNSSNAQIKVQVSLYSTPPPPLLLLIFIKAAITPLIYASPRCSKGS